MAKTDQELAQEEINNRQYMYGGLGLFSWQSNRFLSGERREIIRPESTGVVGFGAGPTGVEYITETIPAEYGPVEYDPSFSPARRGLSALGDILYEAPSFFGLRGPDEQVEAIQGVGSSLRDALFGTAEYMSEQARAAASGGEYFDPETGRTVAFDPTITMFGGNPAEGAVMGSGVRAYHGSPYKFDQFSTERIGSGEGNQSFGHGLYFAENQNIAEGYQRNISRNRGTSGYLYQTDLNFTQDELLDWDTPLSQQPEIVRRKLEQLEAPTLRVEDLSREELIEQLVAVDRNGIYRDADSITEFGKPLTLEELRQSAENVDLQNYLDEQISINDQTTGRSLYERLAAKFGGGNSGARAASAALFDLGIPGIKYLDEPSRAQNVVERQFYNLYNKNNGDINAATDEFMQTYRGSEREKREMREIVRRRLSERTNNFVVFDDSNIEIIQPEGESFFSGGKTGTGIAAASAGSAIAERMPKYQAMRDTTVQRLKDKGVMSLDEYERALLDGVPEDPKITYSIADSGSNSSYITLQKTTDYDDDYGVLDYDEYTIRFSDHSLPKKHSFGRNIFNVSEDYYDETINGKSAQDAISYVDKLVPDKIRSINAEFNPDRMGSANILYSGGGNTGTGIAAGSSLGQLLQEQFPKDYDPRVIESYTSAGIDPRTYAAGSGANTRKPLISQVDRNLSTDIQIGGQRIGDVPTINLEDYEGYPFISSMADRSAAGDVIQSINGVPVDVSRRGGLDYMFDPESGELVWASAPDVLVGQERRSGTSVFKEPREKSILGRAIALREQTGKDPLFIPFSMAPTGVDFSQPAEVMLSHARNALDLSDLNKLDADIKEVFPRFSGINSPDGISQVNQASGDVRKKIINIINNDYSQKGALTSGQARAALLDQAQAMSRDSTLRNVGLIDTSRMITVGDVHPIYKGGLYGEGLGRLADSYSVYELNPQAAYLGGIRPDQLLNPPRSTGMGAGTRKLELSPLTGVITEDVLRGMEARRAQL